MNVRPELEPYLAELRARVCSRCIERPEGGPPCDVLGKICGIESHLEELVAEVRRTKSPLLEPYLERCRIKICAHCPQLGDHECCPCPMDYLGELVVEAIEAVDNRAENRERQALRMDA